MEEGSRPPLSGVLAQLGGEIWAAVGEIWFVLPLPSGFGLNDEGMGTKLAFRDGHFCKFCAHSDPPKSGPSISHLMAQIHFFYFCILDSDSILVAPGLGGRTKASDDE